LAAALESIGHEAYAAYDGVEALEAAATSPPEAVLLDIGLPKLDGYEVARQIRKQPWGKEMTLIALSGWGQAEDKRRALEAGFDHHLTKPVKISDLNSLIDRLTRP
jgi:CheY-like chemotaxis protein